jgi:hypothetical protein
MYAIPRLFTLLLLLTLAVGCSKNPNKPAEVVDLAQARLNDFKLAETDYIGIDIKHPVLTNGDETEYGEIDIVIPRGTTGLRLTPLASNFTNDAFTISPRLGEVRNFSAGRVVYVLTSKADPTRRVQYYVSITEEEPPVTTAPKVTALRFEQSKNAGLTADIVASRVLDGVATLGKIYVFVPAGTDFSQLTPTIVHEGGTLYYSQDPASAPENSTTPYPASGTRIDFAWPKTFYAIVKGATSVAAYEVVVDVRNPIKFEPAVVTTAALQKGSSHFIPVGSLVNQGNHPITLLNVTHTGQVPSGINAIRCSSSTPSLGLAPGQSTVVNATISAQTFGPGTYQTTALFVPGIFRELEANTLLEPSALSVTTTIVD